MILGDTADFLIDLFHFNVKTAEGETGKPQTDLLFFLFLFFLYAGGELVLLVGLFCFVFTRRGSRACFILLKLPTASTGSSGPRTPPTNTWVQVHYEALFKRRQEDCYLVFKSG